jgi:hypothetical protein
MNISGVSDAFFGIVQTRNQFPILFDIVFPAQFQSWLDALAVISLDMYAVCAQHSTAFACAAMICFGIFLRHGVHCM